MFSKLTIAAGLAFALIAGTASAETIKVGVTPGPHAQTKDGLDIEILEFSDYVVPNQALNDGDINANSFQHRPYLDNQVADRGFDIIEVAQNINFPMGIYSKKYKSFDELPNGATVGIPNDPTNGGRALLIIADHGFIKVDETKGVKVTIADITENPKNLNFVELDAAQLPRSLDDTDASAVNSNYAIEAGLNSQTDTILAEGEKAPYINIIAVRSADKDAPWLKQLIAAYHNDEVKQFVVDTFKGSVVPAW
jgi:D-methionine transport system substrate-binding protein